MPATASAVLWAAAPRCRSRRENRAARSSCTRPRCPRRGVLVLSALRALSLQQREAQRFTAREIGTRHGARQGADPEDVALPLGDGNGTPRIEQIESVRGLEHLLVGGQ